MCRVAPVPVRGAAGDDLVSVARRTPRQGCRRPRLSGAGLTGRPRGSPGPGSTRRRTSTGRPRLAARRRGAGST
ncbi:hypothetical protein ACU686_17070 [Yinghuangia aomiensis]